MRGKRAAAGAESGTGEAGCSGAGGRICLNDQGGTQMDVSEDVTGTLRAESMGISRVFWKLLVSVPSIPQMPEALDTKRNAPPTLRAGVITGRHRTGESSC